MKPLDEGHLRGPRGLSHAKHQARLSCPPVAEAEEAHKDTTVYLRPHNLLLAEHVTEFGSFSFKGPGLVGCPCSVLYPAYSNRWTNTVFPAQAEAGQTFSHHFCCCWLRRQGGEAEEEGAFDFPSSTGTGGGLSLQVPPAASDRRGQERRGGLLFPQSLLWAGVPLVWPVV